MTPTTIPSPPFLTKPWQCMVHGTPRSANVMLPLSNIVLPPSPKQSYSFAIAIALQERCVECLAKGLWHCSLCG
jgi:hypothetical protein